MAQFAADTISELSLCYPNNPHKKYKKFVSKTDTNVHVYTFVW